MKLSTVDKTVILFQATVKMTECLSEIDKKDKTLKYWINNWINAGKKMQRELELSTGTKRDLLNEISFNYLDILDKLENITVDDWDKAKIVFD